MDKPPKNIDQIIPKLMRAIESSYPDESHRIWAQWPDAVGPEIARRAGPLDFRNGHLTLAVVSAAWAQQLTLMSPRIIEALNARLGKELVKSLRCRQATVEPPPPDPVEEPDWSGEALNEEELEEVEQSAFHIDDPVLAKSIRRARRMSLKRRRYLRSQAGGEPPRSI